MAAVHSIREFHSEMAGVCDALESLFQLAGSDYSLIQEAARPAMERFREVLDSADSLAGSDTA